MKQVNKVYCTNCSNNLHNEYKYLGEGKVKLLKRRCKGEVFDQFMGKKDTGDVIKCECLCQTHYVHEGHIVPIGQTPQYVVERRKQKDLKPLDPEIAKMISQYNSKRDQQVPPTENKFLGKVGTEKDEIVKDGDENVAGGYLFKETLTNFRKKKK